MATVTEVYERALALYDEISKTGTIDAGKTADYRARAPRIVDLLQKELIAKDSIQKIYEYAYVADSTLPWVVQTLPSDFDSLVEVILSITGNNYYVYTDYLLERDGNTYSLYLMYPNDCTVRVKYKFIPTTITAITDALQVDEITAQAISYGLCKWFAVSEQNEFVASYCENKFNELKVDNRSRRVARTEDIIDVYR